MTLRFTIPGRTKNTANLREHWATKAKRVQAERRKAMTVCPRWVGGPLLVVTLIRYGPRELDGDGLQSALKGTRDGIAARLRVDDGTPLVRWDYLQRTCKAGLERVDVVISTAPEEQPEGRVWTPTAEQLTRLEGVWNATPTAATYRRKTKGDAHE